MCLTTVIGISKCHENWVPVIFYQYKITDHLRSAYSLPIPYLLCKSLNLSVKRRMCLTTVIGYSKCHENWVPVISYQYKITDHLRSSSSSPMQFLLCKKLNSSVKRRMCLTTVIGISKCHENWVPIIFYQYKITDHLWSANSIPIQYLLCKILNLSVKRRIS